MQTYRNVCSARQMAPPAHASLYEICRFYNFASCRCRRGVLSLEHALRQRPQAALDQMRQPFHPFPYF